MREFIEFQKVYKRYRMGEVVINAANGISFGIKKGEFAIVVGPSGAGKTTVLNILGGMSGCDEGKIYVGDKEIAGMNAKELASYRRYDTGFVFQFYNLIQNLTAKENVELATQICRDPMDAVMNAKELASYRRYDTGFVFQFYNLIQNLTAKENVELATQICRDPMDAVEALKAVGLAHRLDNFPSQLSGGEQQRVAIARALAKRPQLLLCDEPTGALDYNTGKNILKLLQDTCRSEGMTVVLITHNQAITPMADRVITMKNGLVEDMYLNQNPKPVEEIEW